MPSFLSNIILELGAYKWRLTYYYTTSTPNKAAVYVPLVSRNRLYQTSLINPIPNRTDFLLTQQPNYIGNITYGQWYPMHVDDWEIWLVPRSGLLITKKSPLNSSKLGCMRANTLLYWVFSFITQNFYKPKRYRLNYRTGKSYLRTNL